MFRALVEGLAAALPGQCAVCRAWPAEAVCEACVARFAQPRDRCRRCALPVAHGAAECGRRLKSPPPLDACHAALPYEYPWSTLIARYKFSGQAGWARSFATLMRSAPWVEPSLDECDLVLPLPLSGQRLAERGFNQALVLARALAPHKAESGLLLRVRHTAAQAELGLKGRLQNVQGAFTVEPLRAAPLRQAGAGRVTGLVLARTDEPAPQ